MMLRRELNGLVRFVFEILMATSASATTESFELHATSEQDGMLVLSVTSCT